VPDRKSQFKKMIRQKKESKKRFLREKIEHFVFFLTFDVFHQCQGVFWTQLPCEGLFKKNPLFVSQATFL